MGFSCLNSAPEAAQNPTPSARHEAHCERFKSERNSLVQAIPPEDDSGTGRSVNLAKLTDSLQEDSAPTSVHSSLRKQSRLEDIQTGRFGT